MATGAEILGRPDRLDRAVQRQLPATFEANDRIFLQGMRHEVFVSWRKLPLRLTATSRMGRTVTVL